MNCKCGAAIYDGRARCTSCRKPQRPKSESSPVKWIPANVTYVLQVQGHDEAAAWFAHEPAVIANIEDNRRRIIQRIRGYKLTFPDWLELVALSRSSCFICGHPQLPLDLVIDHDHETGHVRGLLCQRCNTGLGMLRIDGTGAVRRVDSIRRYLVSRTPFAAPSGGYAEHVA